MFYIFFDLMMSIIYFLVGFYFYKSKGKANRLLTGYKFSRHSDDYEVKLAKIYGKRIMCWSLIFIFGMVIDIFLEGSGCLIAWIVWIVFFVYHLRDRSRREK